MSSKRGKSFPRSSEETRTTEKHVFKPPEHGGTVSQSRAERWQNASMTSTAPPVPESGGRGNAGKAPRTSGRSSSPEPSQPLAPAVAPPPKPSAPMARDNLDLKQVAPPAELEGHWFTYEPLAPLPGRHGPHDFDGVRLGMSHPPQNQKVRKELLAYLYARKVRIPQRPTLKKRSEQSASDPSFVRSPGARRGVGQSPERTMRARGPAPAQRSKSRPSGLPLLGDGRSWASEEDVQKQSELLRQNSRYLGFELAKKEVKDLAELSMYHNKMTRRHQSFSKQDKSPVQLLRELKQQCLIEEEKDASRYRQERKTIKPELSLSTQFFAPTLRPQLSHQETGPLATGGQASPDRLRRIAHQLSQSSSAGPCRLQLMARATGINVVTGGLRPEALDAR